MDERWYFWHEGIVKVEHDLRDLTGSDSVALWRANEPPYVGKYCLGAKRQLIARFEFATLHHLRRVRCSRPPMQAHKTHS